MNRQIGVGIIGVDHWYNAIPFLEQLRNARDFKAIMVADHNPERAQELAKLADSHWAADQTEALNHPEIDIIATFTSTDKTAAVCIDAANHDKHILANKPIGMNAAEARQVLEVVSAKNLIFFPFEAYARLTPLHQQLKGWVKEGRIGDIQSISYTHEAALPVDWTDSDEPGWWTDSHRTPGGGWIDHAIYQIDFIRWLGQGKVVDICGHIGNFKYQALTVEDYGIATMALDSGIVATSKAHWLAPKGAFRRVIEVLGTEGVILVDSTDDRIRLAGHFQTLTDGGDTPEVINSGGFWQCMPLPKPQGSVLLDHLKAVMEEKAAPVATAVDAKENLDICLSFYNAATRIATQQTNHARKDNNQ